MGPNAIHRVLLCMLLQVAGVAMVEAQTFWATDIGGPGNDHVSDVKSDAAGDIYLTGEFSGSITFGGVVHQSSAGIDVFVAIMSPVGQVIWFRQGGGPGIDRGIKLAVGNGQVAVVGEFMFTADLMGQSLTSAGGPDIFLALLDASTGNLVWATRGGGALSSDRPYGVSIAPGGGVTMAGEFRGTADIAGSSLTSMLDPNSLDPSVDVFIASYAAGGTPLWVVQGSAKFTDRAIDVVHDGAGNVYVAGQFSDTIQFVSTHPNAMYNATFLLKLDPAGNEVWFRRVGGAVFDHVRDIQWSSMDDLLLVGDLQGTMIFLDSVPDLISAGAPYAYYLLRVDANGQLTADTVVTSEGLISGRALDERNGIVSVLGQFSCSFTSRVDSTHTGQWMATGPQDLFLLQHDLDSLYVMGGQQFGGREEKLAGQITTLLDGSPVFCGSYEDLIVFPCKDVFTADITSFSGPHLLMTPNPSGYCGDPHYGNFAADTSNGLKDGFIARGYVPGRAPYDWWERNGPPCSYMPGGLCLGEGPMAFSCPDTISVCGGTIIGIDPAFSFHIDHRLFFVGPDLDFAWNTGDTTDSLYVDTTGTYAVTCTSSSGCLVLSDSIHVAVHPWPAQPLLSDDVTPVNDSPLPWQASICDPDSALLWCSNADTATTFFWHWPGGQVFDDSLVVDTGGTYTFTMVTPFGCTTQNHVQVIDLPTLAIPNMTVELVISYPQDTDQNDSLDLCPYQGVNVLVTPTWYLNGSPYTPPNGLQYVYIIDGGVHLSLDPGPWAAPVAANADGWSHDWASVIVFNGPCGSDSLQLPDIAEDSIHVHLYPATPVDIVLDAPDLICPSDTALLVAACDSCDAIAWSGGGILAQWSDSLLALGGGFYQVTGTVVDTNGCSFSETAWHVIQFPDVPELDVFPSDGIICPDSIATVYTNALGSYDWYGPIGQIAINNDSIDVTWPGEYYLELIDTNGCYLISDPILVTGYATPFLNVLPDGVLCVDEDPVLLQVVTTGASSLAWDAPLSGSDLEQLVDQPGTYSCSVQACGITTLLSVDIIMGTAQAEVVDPGPFTLCPGDTLDLLAQGGQAAYLWMPGAVFGSTLTVTEPGNYTLVALDGNGCTDTSAAVLVSLHDMGGPLTISDITVCAGDPVVLEETAPGDLAWYADSALTQLMGFGAQLDLGMPMDTLMLYLVRSDSACTNPAWPVVVNVVQPPDIDLAMVSDTVCQGGTVQFVTMVPSPFLVEWNTPQGLFAMDTLQVGPLGPSDSGWYIAIAGIAGCTGAADSVHLYVHQPAPIDLGADTALCPGSTLYLDLPVGYTDPQWSDGSMGPFLITDQQGVVGVTATDPLGCAAQGDLYLTMLTPTLPVEGEDVTICQGADAMLEAIGSGSLIWYADPALQIPLGMGGNLVISAPTDSLFVYLVQEDMGCTGQPLSIAVNVVPVPVDVVLIAPGHLCLDAVDTLSVQGPAGLAVDWSTPIGGYSGTVLVVGPAQPSDEGWYGIVPAVNGCTGAADSVYLEVYPPTPFDLGADMTLCSGSVLVLEVPSGYSGPIWNTGDTTTSITVQNGGTFSVSVFDGNGCPTADTLLVQEIDCPPVAPNVVTPNGDGTNDTFSLGLVGAIGGEVRIYDRWGVLVHSGDPVNVPWDVTYDSTHEPVPDGTYYYVLEVRDVQGHMTTLRGYFTILR